MKKMLLFPIGTTESCRYASGFLRQAGVSLIDHPSPDITHLLMDVPSFGCADLQGLLRMLPGDITIISGKLTQDISKDYSKIDLMQDPVFLAENAAITAECALRAASPYINTTFADTPVLILGWGRIGKCLARLLAAIGCPVTVAVRKKTDLAMLKALSYEAVEFSRLHTVVKNCRLLFNTVPNLILPQDVTDSWDDLVKIDLASYPGMEYPDVIPARGLPGKFAPESAGRLIAETILRICKEEIS